jgi:prepilin-type processing-associated H-X9-DG protein
LALHNYHDLHSTLPPATAMERQPSRPGYGWGTFLLPQLDQTDLYNQLRVSDLPFSSGSSVAAPTPLTQTPLPLFVCASDTGPELNPSKGDHAKSNYRGVSGAYDLPWSPMGGPAVVWPMDSANGVLFVNSKVRLADVTDGTSNTIVIAECASDHPDKVAAIWVGVRSASATIVFISDVAWLVSRSSFRINGPSPQSSGSRHSGGAHFSFADGAVHFISENIDGALFEALATRAGGEALGGL